LKRDVLLLVETLVNLDEVGVEARVNSSLWLEWVNEHVEVARFQVLSLLVPQGMLWFRCDNLAIITLQFGR
jgi:hypothetical protein